MTEARSPPLSSSSSSSLLSAQQLKMITPDPQHGIKVDASEIAEVYRREIRQRVQELKQQGVDAPLLVGLLANGDPAAKKYAEWTGKACLADGLRYELRELDNPLLVEAALLDANQDPRVHGIIVYYPMFANAVTFSGQSRDDYLRDTVRPECDVEGLSFQYRSNLYRNRRFLDPPRNTQKSILPCTALSVIKLLEQSCFYDTARSKPLCDVTVTVVNRSEIVGRPLAAMLANDGAVVYSVDIDTIYQLQHKEWHDVSTVETPESCVRKSSIVVTGVPTKSYCLPSAWIQPGTVVINVSSFKNVNEAELLAIPRVVYVPMVGKVTVAMLERNLMRLFDQFHHPQKKQQYQVLQQQQQDQSNDNLLLTRLQQAVQVYTAFTVTFLLLREVWKMRR